MALDAAKTICDTGLTCWDRVSKYRKYIRSLRDNLNALKSKVDELGRVYDDVNRFVRAAEGEGWARNSDVDGWLKKVETLKREAGKILEDGGKIVERKCLCGLCFWNCRSRYKQSCLAEAKKADVEAELSRGHSFRVKEDVAYEPADLILKRSVEALRDKMGELQDVFETVKQRVRREEEQHSVRTPELGGWLKRVEDLLGKEALEVLEEGELELVKSRQSTVRGDSQYQRNSPLYHGIAKRVDDKRALLEQKLVEGHGFTVFTGKPNDPPILEIPCERPIGAESMFEEIWNWVEDETVRCIGLFGMGGVGKTNLLNRVHNQFCQVTHDYNFALRIVVSRPANLDRIQEAILKELKLPKDQWDDLERIRRASLIYKLMKEKNFLLFLDDLWDPIDLLNDIGIPCRDHLKKCKIILTTREEGVCNRMHTDKRKKVECLPLDEALQLFRQKLGEDTWGAHPLIPKFAKSLVHECQCLPIALITVARAMAGTIDLAYWMDAENYLKSHMSQFTDMSEKVLANLEFSYQNLPSKTHKICFLYLSIFPEDHEIDEDDVINLWMGEGFLDDCGDVHKARKYGEQIFRRLQQACLVESVKWHDDGDSVKMHDVIREMALWVDSEHGSKTNTILVQENLGSFRLEELKKCDEAKRMSLWGPRCNSLAGVSCSHLSTLIMRETDLRMIPDDFFLSMPCLRVLDMSCNKHPSNLPKSIWKLINLRYLNLNFYLWEIVSKKPILVPAEIKNLNKLEVLILSGIFLIPSDVLSNLSSVKVFGWLYTIRDVAGHERGVLEELPKMQSVEEISIYLSSQDSVKMLMGCKNLHSHLRGLSLCGIDGLDLFRISTSSVRRLEHLSFLQLDLCDTSKIQIGGEDNGSDDSLGYSYVESLARKPSSFGSLDIFHSLRDVTISSCVNLVDVTSLIVHAPTLKMLSIVLCSSLKEVIVGDIKNISIATNGIFPCLAYLSLVNLESLERICRTALHFPSLKKIKVIGCSKLKKLPFDCDSAKSLQVIEGRKEWLEKLEWDDPTAKQVFSAKFAIFSDAEVFDDEDSD